MLYGVETELRPRVRDIYKNCLETASSRDNCLENSITASLLLYGVANHTKRNEE